MATTPAEPAQPVERSAERLVTFTDGVVAIAVTLLVLPLVDVAKETGHEPVTTVLSDHLGDFLAFVLSFVVVGLFWRVHHRLFDLVERVDEPLLVLNTCWLFGVVFMPAPTAVLAFQEGSSRAAAVLYLANLLYVTLLGVALNAWLRRHPDLQFPGHTADLDRFLRRGIATSAVVAVATLAAAALGTWGLLVLCLLPVTRRATARVAQK